MAYKRTSKKTGPRSKETTTYSSKGITRSHSTKSDTGTRRTVSWNSATGKTRTTWTSKNGGGWITSKTTTSGGNKKPWTGTKGHKTSSFNLFGGRKKKNDTIDWSDSDKFSNKPMSWFWIIVLLPISLPAMIAGWWGVLSAVAFYYFYLFG